MQSFIQDWGTYSNETFVFVDYSLEEIIKRLKNKGWTDLANKIEAHSQKKDSVFNKKNNGLSWVCGSKSILIFKDWKNDTKHLGLLTHELYHLIFAIMHRQKGMATENEACAYQISYLFREIKDKLKKA